MPANGLHPDIRLVHVPRSYNKSADSTLSIAFVAHGLHFDVISQIFFLLLCPTELANEAMDEQQSWMTRSEDGHQQRYPLPAS